mmetsp:Transcript_25257/g.55078  ORF Transcript_25257/g.55078 Transcript_25257/m.55078 type:complete len:229 (-) Transcript_25257:329-1015(-)
MAGVGIVAIHSNGVATHVFDQLQIPPAPVRPHGPRDVRHEVVVHQWRARFLHRSRAVGNTFDCVIAGIQEPRRGKGLVDHSAGLRTGHWVDLVDEGLKLIEAAHSRVKTRIFFGISIDAVIHRPVHGFPTEIVDAGRAAGDAGLGGLTHPLFEHTLSFRRSVASQTEAFVGHAAGQTTRGVAVGPATLTSGVQVAHIFGLRRAFGGFLVVVVALLTDASPMMAGGRTQ